MSESLKEKTIGALIWNFADRFGQQALQFAVAVIVANILFPDDYALVAMLAIFTAIGNLIVESGFGAALIQKRQADNRDFSTVFWFNLAMSLLIYALLMAASPLIVAYFHEPLLTRLAAVVFLALPLNATMLIQNTLLNKQIRFRQLAKVDLLSMLFSSTCAIGMAAGGCGVWTLAWQPVTLAASKSALLWFWSDWRPKRYFSFRLLRELFGFSSSLLAAGLVNTVFLNIYSLVLPKLYPKRELGYFTQGNKICDPIVSLIYGSIQNATYPIFSGIQDEHDRLINAYRKSIRFTAFLTFPMMCGAIAVAPALFRLLFKEAWWAAMPFFQLLCMGGCFTILTAINNNFIKVSGRSSGILKIEIFKIALTAAAIALFFRQGVLTMVGGLISVRLFVYIISMAYTQRYTGYRLTHQLRDILPYLAVSLFMMAAVWSVSLVVAHHLLLLVCQLITGMTVYFLIAYLSGSKILRESIELLKRKK
ncbi:flippase [Prevotella sp. oral taxon 376]|uniref:lipopolysaccharide biosynthesis protein n=1 Tax=Prevotella sp. oral taxon 376 TaxID=712466 RepID=UPI000D1E07BD|nr:lipopolysaccharide biosynthesis protein [Prevotella sp. oral taxon 376]PTL33961.1 flippase [Prevotella sp. oral taxon 376]